MAHYREVPLTLVAVKTFPNARLKLWKIEIFGLVKISLLNLYDSPPWHVVRSVVWIGGPENIRGLSHGNVIR